MELLIQKLKDAGASQMGCTRTLVRELNMPLLNADQVVVNSKAWSANRESVYKLRKAFFDVLDKA
ncbi:MAG: hypothetical protein ACX93T_03300 [Bacteroidota bacterium]